MALWDGRLYGVDAVWHPWREGSWKKVKALLYLTICATLRAVSQKKKKKEKKSPSRTEPATLALAAALHTLPSLRRLPGLHNLSQILLSQLVLLQNIAIPQQRRQPICHLRRRRL